MWFGSIIQEDSGTGQVFKAILHTFNIPAIKKAFPPIGRKAARPQAVTDEGAFVSVERGGPGAPTVVFTGGRKGRPYDNNGRVCRARRPRRARRAKRGGRGQNLLSVLLPALAHVDPAQAVGVPGQLVAGELNGGVGASGGG